MKKLLTINLLLCALLGSALVFAQSQSTPTEDGCRRFRTPVRQAPDDLDKSMVIKDNGGQTLAKGKVIDPCRNASLPVRGKVKVLGEFQYRPTVEEFLKTTPSPTPKLKTPAEILRDNSKPKSNPK